MAAKGPPYPPVQWSLGGPPEIIPDIPITAVFLFLFILSAITHMTIFQLNRKRGHKFLMSGLLFGFSMARIVTCTLRIVSVRFSTNVSLAIAAQVFVSAGVVIVYIVNLIFTQRVLRAQHPHSGWHSLFSLAFKITYALIIIVIAMVIVVTVQSFYTLSPNTHRIDRDIQLAGITFFAFVSFLPIPLVLLGLSIPRKTTLDKFGKGKWRTKIFILLSSAFLICFGASYRCGTAWLTPVPRTEPLPAYFNKAAFYMVNFGVEIIVVFMYAILRVDIRFHVPDGARGPGSYSGRDIYSKHKSVGGYSSAQESYSEAYQAQDVASVETERIASGENASKWSLPRIMNEEETFDGVEHREARSLQAPELGEKEDLESGQTINSV